LFVFFLLKVNLSLIMVGLVKHSLLFFWGYCGMGFISVSTYPR